MLVDPSSSVVPPSSGDGVVPLAPVTVVEPLEQATTLTKVRRRHGTAFRKCMRPYTRSFVPSPSSESPYCLV